MYLLKDAQNKDDFNINDVYKEEDDILEFENGINGYEINYIHSTCTVEKETKDRYKEE